MDTDAVNGVPFVTGELRSTLQPIVYLRLTGRVSDGRGGGPSFNAGDIVAAQFWGEGRVSLTRFPDGAHIAVIASMIEGEILREHKGYRW